MSDATPPPFPSDADVPRENVTPLPEPFEAVLADFRAWIREHLEQAESILAGPPSTGLDVTTLLGHFTALRQEINLQTRSQRSQLEQNAQTLEQLSQAFEALQTQQESSEDEEPAPAHESIKPILKTLIDSHDVLALAQSHVRKMQATVVSPEQGTPSSEEIPSEKLKIRLPYWTKWFGLDTNIEAQIDLWQQKRTKPVAVVESEAFIRQKNTVDSILTGYAMSLQRLERAMEQLGLERMDCVGEPFDPETMEVVDVVKDPSRTGTEVLEEVRPGYYLEDKLFRYAQVRVARP